MVKRKRTPIFSSIVGNPRVRFGAEAPQVVHSRWGDVVQEEIDKLQSYRPEAVRLVKTVIMPDHVHILLRVLVWLKWPITNYISMTMSAITSRLRREGALAEDESTFEEGITDSIVYGEGRLVVLHKYVCDNPRRLLMKRRLPDLFKRRSAIMVGEFRFDCVGNIFLLRRPLTAVHVRRKWDDAEKEAYRKQCLEDSAQGCVLISPFIHPMEKTIMREAIEDGGSVVRLTDRGFGNRWKPSGNEFDLCAEGRLLFLAETGSPLRKTDMRYRKASHLNQIAEHLADHPELAMTLKAN